MASARTRAGSPSRVRTALSTTPTPCRRLTRSSRPTSASCSSERRKRTPSRRAHCGRTNTPTEANSRPASNSPRRVLRRPETRMPQSYAGLKRGHPDGCGPIELGSRCARHELERRGSRLRGQHAVEDVSGVPAVLGPVGGIDLIVDVVARCVDECDVLQNAAGSYAALTPLLGFAEPIGIAAPDASNEQVVPVADGPYGRPLSELALAPAARDLDFLRGSQPAELITLPPHTRAPTLSPRPA